MNNSLMFATGNDETGTPWPFFQQLNAEFYFVCDVAATRDNAKLPTYYGPDHIAPQFRDCLTLEWPTHGPVWMNPPYSDPEHACRKTNCKKKLCVKRGFHVYEYRPGCIDFVRKAAMERMRGVTTVALLAARTDTAWWHDYIYDTMSHEFRPGVSARFLRGRLKFEGHKDSAPFPSVIVIFKGDAI